MLADWSSPGAEGVELTITSGYCSPERQRQLYEEAVRKHEPIPPASWPTALLVPDHKSLEKRASREEGKKLGVRNV